MASGTLCDCVHLEIGATDQTVGLIIRMSYSVAKISKKITKSGKTETEIRANNNPRLLYPNLGNLLGVDLFLNQQLLSLNIALELQ